MATDAKAVAETAEAALIVTQRRDHRGRFASNDGVPQPTAAGNAWLDGSLKDATTDTSSPEPRKRA